MESVAEDEKRVGQRLAEWRRARGLTLRAVAEGLGLSSPSTISEYESGNRSPSYASALALQKLSRGAIKVEHWGFDRKTGRKAGARAGER